MLSAKALALQLTPDTNLIVQLRELQKVYLSPSSSAERFRSLYPQKYRGLAKSSQTVKVIALKMLDLQQLTEVELPYLAMCWHVGDAEDIIHTREALKALLSFAAAASMTVRGELLEKALMEQPVLLANILATVPLDISSVLDVFNQPSRLELFLSTLRGLKAYKTHRRYLKDLLLFLSQQAYPLHEEEEEEEEGGYLEMLEAVVQECHLSHYLDYLVLIRTSLWLPSARGVWGLGFQEHLQSILLLGGEAEIVTLDLEAYLSPSSIHDLAESSHDPTGSGHDLAGSGHDLAGSSQEERSYDRLLEQVQEPSDLSTHELQSYLTQLLQSPIEAGTKHPYRLFLEMLLRRVLVQRAVKENYARLL